MHKVILTGRVHVGEFGLCVEVDGPGDDAARALAEYDGLRVVVTIEGLNRERSGDSVDMGRQV